jgi:cytosine/uracil/thiamine/allantoin permease
MMDLTQLAIVAFLVESLLQTVKPLYDREKGWNKSALFALVVGVVICLLTSTDLFTKVGLTISVPYVGSVLTGVLASRGSNFLHDIFKFVQNQAEVTESQQGGVG